MTDDLPTTKQELERKLLDSLESLTHRVESGKLSKADAALVAKELWGVSAGLVDNSISELCTLAAAEFKPKGMSLHFVGNGKVASLSWKPDAPFMGLVIRDPSGVTTTQVRRIDFEPGEGDAKRETVIGSLAKSGFIRL